MYQSQLNGQPVEALKNITFSVEEGEYIASMGESGSGKSTLLNLMATLDQPTAGELALNGIDLTTIKRKRRCRFSPRSFGLGFSRFQFIGYFSVKDNILLPLVLSESAGQTNGPTTATISANTGNYRLVTTLSYELSGGQKQRVAVARAIITKPDLFTSR